MARGVAAVIGGSIAGLLAAKVLASEYEQVVIFDRDDLLATGPRKGTPQAHHVHVLLAAGSRVIDRICPGLFDDIAARGGRYVDMSQHNNWFHFGVWKRRFECGVRAHAQSRLLLESELRRRVLGLTNVKTRRSAVEHVKWPAWSVRPRVVLEGKHLDVDFLVDASGRGSKMSDWLEAAGYARPREEKVEVDVSYTSARYRSSGKRDWMGLLVYPEPPAGRRAAAVLPTETGEIIVSQFGWCGEKAGADDAAFSDFAASLPQPEVAEFLAQSERVSDFYGYHYREARLRHYAGLRRRPPATIVLGDALCSVDPVFGQGMTVAALAAEALQQSLRERIHPAGGYWQRVPAAYRGAWQLSTGEDFRYREVRGVRPLGTAFTHWYTAHVHRLVALDDDVYRRFARVMHLLEPPTHLLHPSVAAKVLRAAFRGGGAAPSGTRPRGP
jgi:2-polyprenyl-6-methoxyphenol hydroxylase-like FAD-dependent oxidoreductase